jgi:(hydroxyamino)benzene mutase
LSIAVQIRRAVLEFANEWLECRPASIWRFACSFELHSLIENAEEENAMQTDDRRLMWYGMFLFLLGLLTGFAEHLFTNVRMGLSAHLEGVLNGIFLVALGAIWDQVRLPHAVKVTAFWTALYGTYVNWLVTSIAASFGTAANSPITSAGHHGKPWQETFVATGFLTVAIAIVATSVLVLWGLRARSVQHNDSWTTAQLGMSRVGEGRRS